MIEEIQEQEPQSLLYSDDRNYQQRVYQFMRLYQEQPFYQQNLNSLLALAPLTDMGNAKRFYARFGNRLRWNHDRGKWLEFDGTKWTVDTDNIALSLAGQTVTMIYEEAKTILPQKISKDAIKDLSEASKDAYERAMKLHTDMLKWAIQSQSKAHLENMVSMLKSEPGDFYRDLYPTDYPLHKIVILDKNLDEDDNLINFKNGSLRLGAYEMILQPHNRYDFCMKQIPHSYVPDAKAPQWKAFITKISQEPSKTGWKERSDLETYIQVISGLGLYGAIIDEVLPIFVGHGSNGKSVFSEILKHALGDYSQSATTDLFMQKQGSEGINNDVARLSGTRLLIASETEEGRRLNEQAVKSLTGGDAQAARFLRQEFFEFVPKFMPILMTNHTPGISGTDHGIKRRLKIVPWSYNFDLDPERKDREQVMRELKGEVSGILNWLVEGLQLRLTVNQLTEFEPLCVKVATNIYIEDNDVLHQYIDEYMIKIDGESISKDDFYKAFSAWAIESGMKHPPTKSKVGTRLKERLWEDKRTTGGKHVWLDWRLRIGTDPLPIEPTPPIAMEEV